MRQVMSASWRTALQGLFGFGLTAQNHEVIGVGHDARAEASLPARASSIPVQTGACTDSPAVAHDTKRDPRQMSPASIVTAIVKTWRIAAEMPLDGEITELRALSAFSAM